MENRQNVSHGFDMLNVDKSLENRELKTTSPILAPADRWVNEDEEVAARSDSSSGGSSLSDLRKRLQHLGSPNDATRLANHAVHASRRLSRKRDFFFRGASIPIEENVEREEREERESSQFFKKSLDSSDLKSKDARTRRRAKIRLENASKRVTVLPAPPGPNPLNTERRTENDPIRGRHFLVESGANEILREEKSERQFSNNMEISSGCQSVPQQYSSLSARLPSTNSPYRSQRDDSINDSSRCQRKASFLRHYSSLSCENSPKDRGEPRNSHRVPLRSVRPLKFGGYRPQSGLILRNLSSGSEAESNREVLSDRLVYDRAAVDPSIFLERGLGEPSPYNGDSKIEDSDCSLPYAVSSARRSTNLLERKGILENIMVSSIPDARIDAERFNESSLPFGTRSQLDNPNSSRSDGSRCGKNIPNRNVEEPIFLSAREGVVGYNGEQFLNISKIDVPEEVNRSVVNFETDVSGPSTRRSVLARNRNEDLKEVFMNAFTDSTSFEFQNEESKASALAPNGSRSSRDVVHCPEFESPSREVQVQLPGQRVDDSTALKRAISKSILTYDEESPRSRDEVFSPQFKTRSGASSSRESTFAGEFTRMLEENLAQVSFKIVGEQELVKVPALALASREVSCSTSPGSRVSSEGRLDLDALTTTRSDAPVKRQIIEEAGGNTCGRSGRDDDRTVSRPGSSENDLSLDKRSDSLSLRSTENRSTTTTKRTSGRSEQAPLSMRSKIPVKIPANKSKLSMAGKFGEPGGQVTIVGQRSPMESSPEATLRFGSARSDRVFESRGTSTSVRDYGMEDIREAAEILSDSPVKEDSKVQAGQQSSPQGGHSREESEEASLERARESSKSARSTVCLSTQTDGSSREKSEIGAKGKDTSREGSFKDTSSDEATPDNRPEIGDSFGSSKFSDDSKADEKTGQNSPADDDVYSESESDTSSSRSYEIQGRPSDPGIEILSPEIETAVSKFGNYRSQYFSTVYEGEVFGETTGTRKSNLIENQIGDGGCREVSMEDPKESKFEGAASNSSPEDEDYARGKRLAENRDKLRFSLEKLAADQFRRSIDSERAKTIRSDTAAFFAEKLYEIPQQFPLACSSSTSKLRQDRSRDSPRFKKKSQDRFPFTISEKTSVSSVKFKVPGRLSNLDEDEEDKGYRLDTHPSITRLAGSGFEDSPADIISYVTRTERGDRRVKPTGMKGLVKKFSARWKKSKRRDGGADADVKVTNVIYENRDYREECESSMDSGSESSFLKGLKMYESLETELRKDDNGDSPDEKSSVVRDKKGGMNPCRRYDKDDLWVRAFKNPDSDREEGKEDAEAWSKTDESGSKRDPYSVFFVKTGRETPGDCGKSFAPGNEERRESVSTERKKNRVKFRDGSLTATEKLSEGHVSERPGKSRNSERLRRNRSMQTGCLCLRFYRMIVPISFGSMSKYRSGINDNSSAIRKRARSLSQKRKG